jgi:hypothetical protein
MGSEPDVFADQRFTIRAAEFNCEKDSTKPSDDICFSKRKVCQKTSCVS